MSTDLIRRLREYADVCAAGEKPHWAAAMYEAAVALGCTQAGDPALLAMLKKARDGLSGGLWDYGPGQDEHTKCQALIEEIDALLASPALAAHRSSDLSLDAMHLSFDESAQIKAATTGADAPTTGATGTSSGGMAQPAAWLVTSKTGLVRAALTSEPSDETRWICDADGDTITPLYAAQQAAQAPERKPLSEGRVELMDSNRYRGRGSDFDYSNSAWYRLGIRDAERVHGIVGTTGVGD